MTPPHVQYLDTDARGAFFLIGAKLTSANKQRFRVTYSPGGMNGYDVVSVWRQATGWTVVAEFGITRQSRKAREDGDKTAELRRSAERAFAIITEG